MGRLISPSRKARACGNCVHFAPTGTVFVTGPTSGGRYATIEQLHGECRARPPKPDRKSWQAVWPDVVAADFCGTFARPETKVERGTA